VLAVAINFGELFFGGGYLGRKKIYKISAKGKEIFNVNLYKVFNKIFTYLGNKIILVGPLGHRPLA